MYLRISCEIWWMRRMKRTALVMGSQKEKSSLSTPSLKTLKDNRVRVVVQDWLLLVVMAETFREVWAGNQTDRSQYFPLFPIYFFLEVINRSIPPFLCLRLCICVQLAVLESKFKDGLHLSLDTKSIHRRPLVHLFCIFMDWKEGKLIPHNCIFILTIKDLRTSLSIYL